MGENEPAAAANTKKDKKQDDKIKPKQWNAVHRKTLEKSLMFVCDNTGNIHRIYVLLMQEGILSLSEKEEIDSHAAGEKKMFELIAVLLKKGHKSLTIFKEVLMKTGNAHVEEEIRGNEYAIVKKVKQTGKVNSDSESDDEKSKKKKKKKKKGKLFSVYEAEKGKGFSVFTATDDEEESSESEDIDAVLDEIDEDNPDINSLLDYLQYAEQKSKGMMYYPQSLSKISRFKDLPTEAVLPKDHYQNALLKLENNNS